MRNLFYSILIIGFIGAGVFAQAELDTTFNSTGIQTVSFGINAGGSDMAIQPDNKIVMAGSCEPSTYQQCVARYNQDGSLDTTFAQQGFLVNFGVDGGSRVALQSDGKIVVGGTKRFDNFPVYSYAPTLTRYTADGVLDSSFGGGNVVIGGAGLGLDSITAMIIQPDGKIVMVGESRAWVWGWGTSSNSRGWAIRYLSNGMPDASFGAGGVRNLGDTLQTSCNAVAVQPDGKLLLSVYTSTGFSEPPPHSMIWRWNLDGSFDPTWGGGDGIVEVPQIGSYLSYVQNLQVMLDGRVVGTSYRNLIRFNPDGALDTSFDGDGVRELGMVAGDPYDLAISASGRITMAALAPPSMNYWKFAVYKFRIDGSNETGFGNDGTLVINPIGESNMSGSNSSACAFDSIGRTVVVGIARATPNRFALVRLVAPPTMSVSVSGRVTDANGNGIANATVSTQGGLTAITTPFGYYTLHNVETNRTYIFSVRSKTDLSFNKRSILIDDQLAGIDFVGKQLDHGKIQTNELIRKP